MLNSEFAIRDSHINLAANH